MTDSVAKTISEADNSQVQDESVDFMVHLQQQQVMLDQATTHGKNENGGFNKITPANIDNAKDGDKSKEPPAEISSALLRTKSVERKR